MGKKRRNHPNLEELLDRPWCYYCERDFEDLKLLISHQKAKHFKCERCGRRLNTAGGLAVHMNQVHKETLTFVENALDGREGLDVEIFGIEGIPDAAVFQHNQKIVEEFHRSRADRQAKTGNPPPGQPGSQGRPLKKIRFETAAELKARLAAYRAAASVRAQQQEEQKAAAAAAGAAAGTAGTAGTAGPGAATTATALPQRPSSSAFAGGAASTLDDLVAGAAAAPPADDIDKIIRMAEAGVRPAAAAAPPPAGEAASDKREKDKAAAGKKDKAAARMVYADGDYSLEEKMAQMPRYAVAV